MPTHSRAVFSRSETTQKKEDFFSSPIVHIQHKLTLSIGNIKKLYASPCFGYLALFQIGLDFKFCQIKTKIWMPSSISCWTTVGLKFQLFCKYKHWVSLVILCLTWNTEFSDRKQQFRGLVLALGQAYSLQEPPVLESRSWTVYTTLQRLFCFVPSRGAAASVLNNTILYI